jgi:hypothetical protein
MVNQYPDSVVFTVYNEPVQDDETGEFTQTVNQTETFVCRADKNSKGSFLTGSDGVKIDYGLIIYMPKTDTVIPIGSKYVLTKGNLTFEGTVKDINYGQFNTTVWV